jgi:hypothetical protein
MRRLPLVLVTALLAATGAAGAASPAFGQEPADPAAVPAAVVAAANALSPQASPCTLMTRELRESVAVRELLLHDPVAAEPFGPDDVTRLCDAYLLRRLGFGSGFGGDRGGWLSTKVSAVRVVRVRGDVAQLQARVAQRFSPTTRGSRATRS